MSDVRHDSRAGPGEDRRGKARPEGAHHVGTSIAMRSTACASSAGPRRRALGSEVTMLETRIMTCLPHRRSTGALGGSPRPRPTRPAPRRPPVRACRARWLPRGAERGDLLPAGSARHRQDRAPIGLRGPVRRARMPPLLARRANPATHAGRDHKGAHRRPRCARSPRAQQGERRGRFRGLPHHRRQLRRMAGQSRRDPGTSVRVPAAHVSRRSRIPTCAGSALVGPGHTPAAEQTAHAAP